MEILRHKVHVRFLPHEQEVLIPAGGTLFEAAMQADVYLQASCGGNGVCGKCKVRIEKGEVESTQGAEESPPLSAEEVEQGIRLACQTRAQSDLIVRIPMEAELDRRLISRKRKKLSGGRQVSPQEREFPVLAWCFRPTVTKRYVVMEPPTIEDNRSDLSRLLQAIKKAEGLEDIEVGSWVLKQLPSVLRQANWQVTVTLGPTQRELQDENPYSAIVVDVGTTTVWGQLLDLNRRTTLAEASNYNSQIHFGDDVISRIVHSQKPGGLQNLQGSIVKTINGIIRELAAKSGVELEKVSHMAAAGNTIMTHLLWGLNPKYIRVSPYTPPANFLPPVRASKLGLEVGDHVPLYTFPMVSSYVGGDIVSGVLASGFYQKKPLTLYIDIGTNGEIVVGHSEWMITAACSAGPAFEGGGIKHGMRAMTGAVEDFRLHPVSYEPMLMTIGMAKPRGICGTGLISIVAEFLEAGVISANGKMDADLPTKRVRLGTNGLEYVLAYGDTTATGHDLVITEVDIENLIRAKAAMYAGYVALLHSLGLSIKDLEQVIIAGNFGYFLDVQRAITIGLLPEIPLERFLFIGNGSLLGARLVSFCGEMLAEGWRIARKMTSVELSENPAYMDHYVAAMFLPHTNESEFPGVFQRLRNKGNGNPLGVRKELGVENPKP
ncbi:MAG: ASKHA domain-containing protein [Deltaproteobacteria bacterium]|nr:ASKHA domain-containing protein [Deltaproteobacteria bacterium]